MQVILVFKIRLDAKDFSCVCACVYVCVCVCGGGAYLKNRMFNDGPCKSGRLKGGVSNIVDKLRSGRI